MPSDTALDRPFDPLRGILLMCLGVSLFPALNTCSKLLNIEGYPVPEIVWARFAGHLLFVAVAFLPRRGLRLFAARRPGLQIGRSLFLLGSTALFISAIGRVPLATASTIGFTTPLLVTALSVPLLGEPVGWRRWSAVVVGFLGALVIIRPGSGLSDPAILVLLGAAAFYALYQIATRSGGAHDTAETGIVYAALVGTLATSLVVPFVFEAPRSLLDLALFLGLGLFGGFGHYFVTRAFQYAPAAVISPLGYVELLGTTILGYLVFGNFPDFWTWVGAAIIIASGAYIAARERRRKVLQRPASRTIERIAK
jgi:drug/metabolite transporter (DMT)-like permease